MKLIAILKPSLRIIKQILPDVYDQVIHEGIEENGQRWGFVYRIYAPQGTIMRDDWKPGRQEVRGWVKLSSNVIAETWEK